MQHAYIILALYHQEYFRYHSTIKFWGFFFINTLSNCLIDHIFKSNISNFFPVPHLTYRSSINRNNLLLACWNRTCGSLYAPINTTAKITETRTIRASYNFTFYFIWSYKTLLIGLKYLYHQNWWVIEPTEMLDHNVTCILGSTRVDMIFWPGL